MGLRNLPSMTWALNRGWVLAANIAADLAAWCQLLGLYDCDGLTDAEPDTLRCRLLHLPARLVRHARKRILKISATWPWKKASPPAGSGCAPGPHPADQHELSLRMERSLPGAVGAGADPSTSGNAVTHRNHDNRPGRKKTGTSQPESSHGRP
jgi:hypothetical protein